MTALMEVEAMFQASTSSAADPLVGYYYKLAILGKPAAELVLAWNIASTSINAVMSAAAAVVIYMPLRSTLIRAGFFDRFR